jgi:hypothetical protein
MEIKRITDVNYIFYILQPPLHSSLVLQKLLLAAGTSFKVTFMITLPFKFVFG